MRMAEHLSDLSRGVRSDDRQFLSRRLHEGCDGRTTIANRTVAVVEPVS